MADLEPNERELLRMPQEELVQLVLQQRRQVDEYRSQADQYQEQLKLERMRSIKVQQEVEQEEELIVNRLMRTLSDLKRQKENLAHQVEQEEQFISSTLQKRLLKVKKEKADLENKLETEQAYIVNSLKKQLEHLTEEKKSLGQEKVDLENQLEAEQEYIVNKLQKQLDKLDSEKRSLQNEKADLQRQVGELGASVERLGREKVLMEQQMEVEEENITNRLQRQLEHMFHTRRMLEERLEKHHIPYHDIPDYGTSNYEMFLGRSPTHSDSSMSASSYRQPSFARGRRSIGGQARHFHDHPESGKPHHMTP